MSITASIKELRLKGQLTPAMQQAGEILGKNPGDYELMAETIRLLILAGQAETASSLYQNFAAANSAYSLEPEALVRLALMLDRRDLLNNIPVPKQPVWLVELLTDGHDNQSVFVPDQVDISVANGPSIFIFSGPCPHCKHELRAQVLVSLLVCRSFLCPNCFGQILMDHNSVKSCLQNNYPELLKMDTNQSDADIIDYLRPKLMGAEEVPEIILDLGQEYHFLINEILVGQMKSQSQDPEAAQ
ncbi:MAG: hypothetical protein GY780_12785 [bacterium]|nr:hypothetical protein [bacterium]